MENQNNDKEQLPNEVGSNLTGTAIPGAERNVQAGESPEQQHSDHQFLEKLQEDVPDAIKKPDDEEALIGDVDPTTRVETSQEQQNGDSQNQSESSKIAGEQL